MPTIYLIRHGQASFGQQNYDQLSDLGKQQAAHLGAAWKQRLPGFDGVALGTMHRHQQTAELCLAEMGQNLQQLDATFDAGWNEYDHQDILAQLRPELATAASTDEFIRQQANPKQAFEQIFNDAIYRWIDGAHDSDYVESWQSFRNRTRDALNTVAAEHKDAKNIAVFTSGGPISLLSQYLLGVPERQLMRMNWTLVNCGVTKIVSTSNRMFVASLSQHVHFEGEHQHFITYR